MKPPVPHRYPLACRARQPGFCRPEQQRANGVMLADRLTDTKSPMRLPELSPVPRWTPSDGSDGTSTLPRAWGTSLAWSAPAAGSAWGAGSWATAPRTSSLSCLPQSCVTRTKLPQGKAGRPS